MAESDSNKEAVYLPADVQAGPDVYGLGILGNQLSPDLEDGEFAVFDPDAVPGRGDIVAVWWKNSDTPSVIKLHLALPPKELWDCSEELSAVMVAETANPKRLQSAPMSKVRAVHRMVGKGEHHA